MTPDPADALAGIVRKLLRSRLPIEKSFRTAMAKALADYEQGQNRFRLLGILPERPVSEGHKRCPECGTPFIPKRITQTYDTPSCRRKACNRRNNPRRARGPGASLGPDQDGV